MDGSHGTKRLVSQRRAGGSDGITLLLPQRRAHGRGTSLLVAERRAGGRGIRLFRPNDELGIGAPGCCSPNEGTIAVVSPGCCFLNKWMGVVGPGCCSSYEGIWVVASCCFSPNEGWNGGTSLLLPQRGNGSLEIVLFLERQHKYRTK